jgi:hypothetical protein
MVTTFNEASLVQFQMLYMTNVSQLSQINENNEKLPSSVPLFKCQLARGAPESLIPVVSSEPYAEMPGSQIYPMLSDMDTMLSASLMTQGMKASKMGPLQDKPSQDEVREYKPPEPSNLDLLLDQHEQELRNQLTEQEEKKKNPRTLYDMINNTVFALNYESPFNTKSDEKSPLIQTRDPKTDVNPFILEDTFSNVFTDGPSNTIRTKDSNITKKSTSKKSTPEQSTPPQEPQQPPQDISRYIRSHLGKATSPPIQEIGTEECPPIIKGIYNSNYPNSTAATNSSHSSHTYPSHNSHSSSHSTYSKALITRLGRHPVTSPQPLARRPTTPNTSRASQPCHHRPPTSNWLPTHQGN